MRVQINQVDHLSNQVAWIKEKALKFGVEIGEEVTSFDKKASIRKCVKTDSGEEANIFWHIVCAMAAYVCPHCGMEMYANWDLLMQESDDSNHLDKILNNTFEMREQRRDFKKAISEQAYAEDVLIPDIKKVQEQEKCPCCQGKLSHEKGYFVLAPDPGFRLIDGVNRKVGEEETTDLVGAWPFNGIDSIFAFMKRYRTEKEEAQLKNKCAQFADSCDVPAVISVSAESQESIKGSTAKLKEYLLNLIKLETNLYALEKRLSVLYRQQFLGERALKAEKYGKIFELKSEIEKAEACYARCREKAKQYADGNTGLTMPSRPAEPIYKEPSLFNKKKVLAENEELKAKYLSDVKEYERKLGEYEREKDRMIAEAEREAEEIKAKAEQMKAEAERSAEGAEAIIPAAEIGKMIDREVSEAEELLKKVYACRNSLYAYEIVFGKYRNAVALSTFYEYLMAGRCTALEGADGAYNLYENQIRADMIIGQLSQVIEKLDDIKDTQYMIYSELQTVNRSLDHLNQTMDTALVSIRNMESDVADISQNTAIIAHNTAVAAHYAKVNAELTNALGFMVALK